MFKGSNLRVYLEKVRMDSLILDQCGSVLYQNKYYPEVNNFESYLRLATTLQ